MNGILKNILISLKIYHPLQGAYRQFIFEQQLKKYRKEYKPFEGLGYTCNVCSHSYSKFVPDYPSAEDRSAIEKYKVIAGYGENIICPNCGSTARERLVLAMLSAINISGETILHLSPEKNIYAYLKDKAAVITADLLPGFYKTIDGRVQKQDATHFTFADETFDIVIGNHILEHIANDEKAMTEIYRVLKPGGRAILQAPYSEIITKTLETKNINDPVLQSALYGQKDHVRIYCFENYIQRLRSAGFKVKVTTAGDLIPLVADIAAQPGEHFLEITKPAKA